MNNKNAFKILNERFGQDTLISLATMDSNRPSVRIVNSYYQEGAFYVVTHARSEKMKQIKKNPQTAICGEWFTAHGVGTNIGHPQDENNITIMTILREAFAAWYSNGHTNEADPHTCILRIQLTDGVLFDHGARYKLDFSDPKISYT